jgi:RsiW-degrading membrane proteinase PrsW (M82 family)
MTAIPGVAVGAPQEAEAGAAPKGGEARKGGWGRIFLGGLALWVATVLVTFVTGNANLVPTVILIGSFLVPVTFVAYAFQRADGVVTAQRIFTAFIYGGTLGILGASILEGEFLKQPTAVTYIYVGLIEEAVRLAALWLIARRLPRYTMRDGIVLGAAVGFGFAALESADYAFNALFTINGLSLVDLVETEVLRGILAPVGHGLWTAILGGALFATAARHGRPRLTGGVAGWRPRSSPSRCPFPPDSADQAGARGSRTSTEVPSPAGLTMVMVPPMASTRSRSPRSPVPLERSAPPTPSSLTERWTAPSEVSALSHATEARACLATLASASATT